MLLACITRPPTTPTDWSTFAPSDRAIDWQRFVALAVHHRVSPLVQSAISHAPARPDAALDRLAKESRTAALYALQLGRAALEVQRAFDAEGLPNLVLKGAPLAVLAFGDVGLKDSRDVDLWVSADHVSEACDLLGRLGYRLIEPPDLDEAAFRRYTAYSKEASLRHETTGMTIDLHWRLVDNPHILQDVTLGGPVQWVPVGPGQVRTLADYSLFAYLCVHGAVHNWARLKWLAELNAWLSHRSAPDLAQLYTEAAALGAGRPARLALLLCHRLLGLDLPQEVHRAIHRDPVTVRLAANAVAGMATIDDVRRWGVQKVRATVGPLFLGGWAFFGHQLRISAVHPGERARLGLPQRLSFVYYLLRLPLWARARVRSATRRAA